MNYKEWETSVTKEIREDSLWNMACYRLALFSSDLCWLDCEKLLKERRTVQLAEQLYRAVGSVGANLAEGYSRGTGRDRARFYEYALSSARESRDWYYKSRPILGDQVFEHRAKLIGQIIRLTLTMIPHQRQRVLREVKPGYQSSWRSDLPDQENQLQSLLENIPLPE